MTDEKSQDIALLLTSLDQGDERAAETLLPLLYEELRALAGSYFRPERPDHTLQPTALVHEAFVKMIGGKNTSWKDRAHFFAVAATAMRQVLINHTERKRAEKRGGGRQRVTLSNQVTPSRTEKEIDLIDLDVALEKLSRVSPEQAKVVEMRFLAGIHEREIAHVLGCNLRTVQRKWRMARAFLSNELDGEGLS